MVYDNVVSLCNKKKISVSALERNVGMSNGSIGKWKNGNPSLKNLKKVADYFGITVNTLIREK